MSAIAFGCTIGGIIYFLKWCFDPIPSEDAQDDQNEIKTKLKGSGKITEIFLDYPQITDVSKFNEFIDNIRKDKSLIISIRNPFFTGDKKA